MAQTAQRCEATFATDRHALVIVFGFLVARLIFALTLGPGVDESYTLAISRTLSLSYFDHPPLHQWIVHFAAEALGERFGARLPFILLFAATGWIYYRMTVGLFGARAAIRKNSRGGRFDSPFMRFGVRPPGSPIRTRFVCLLIAASRSGAPTPSDEVR